MTPVRHLLPGGPAASNSRATTAVLGTLTCYRFLCHDEAELQEAIAEALRRDGIDFEREVSLAPGDRIDFLVGGVGIEVKLAGPPTAVLRQLSRYAASERVESLVLATIVARHATLPDELGGKPLHVVTLETT